MKSITMRKTCSLVRGVNAVAPRLIFGADFLSCSVVDGCEGAAWKLVVKNHSSQHFTYTSMLYNLLSC